MNKLQFAVYPAIAALSLFAAVAAHADDITPDNTASQNWSQTKTRAQVQAELAQAKADGSIRAWSTSYNPLAMNLGKPGAKTRAEVVAEVRAERAAEFATAWYGEDSGSFELARVAPARVATPIYAGLPKTAQ